MPSLNYSLLDVHKVKKEFKSFGTFICAGGSSIGYKLAGFDHLGGVEIDNKCAELYKKNLNPKYLYHEDIREFNKRDDLPDELYNLDLLDGSPPCTTFSTAGKRDKTWGKEKKFKEGQKQQTLDDLVFVYCDTIIKLQPKIAILENVPGIIKGNAKIYTLRIIEKLEQADYNVQVFSLNSASMGLAQKRERVFFIASQKKLNFPKLKLEFSKKPILFGKVRSKEGGKPLPPFQKNLIQYACASDRNFSSIAKRVLKKGSYFGSIIVRDNFTCPTIASGSSYVRWCDKTQFTNTDLIRCGAFPYDYDFLNYDVKYFIGMSVPPLMTYHIACEIIKQWLKAENQNQQN